MAVDPTKVFVVHGRNDAARAAMFTFLRAIGLKPIEWTEAVQLTGSATPYVGQVLDAAFQAAQAVVVLLSGDDEARLREHFRGPHDGSEETDLTPQARPNVLFEAGLAFGSHPNRTILVQVGQIRSFSDIGGRHVIRISNATQQRQALAVRLKTAGCSVSLDGTDWHTTGDFDAATRLP